MTRSVATVQTEIDAVTAARLALAKGERVEEVQRGLDRRSMRLTKVSIPELTTLLDLLNQELLAAKAAEGVSDDTPRRRSAIKVYF